MRNWSDLADSQGTPIVSEFIRLSREGSGYHTHLWPKPSTGEEARMITFVLGFQDWRWAVGTGVFIDDVLASVATARAEVQARVQRTFLYILGITLIALLLVFSAGLFLNIRERRLADVKLKQLTERVFSAQEERTWARGKGTARRDQPDAGGCPIRARHSAQAIPAQRPQSRQVP